MKSNIVAALLCFGLLLAIGIRSATATDWPPADPQDRSTEVNFTFAWAKRLTGFKTLGDLQRAAKAKGEITEQGLDDPEPFVRYNWRSEPPVGNEVGYMLATVGRDGQISVSILTTDKRKVILNNSGAFSAE